MTDTYVSLGARPARYSMICRYSVSPMLRRFVTISSFQPDAEKNGEARTNPATLDVPWRRM